MTIEDWIDKEIRNIENDVRGSTVSYRGARIYTLQDIRKNLPSFDRDVTLKEFVEFCKTHKQCSRCSIVDQCRFDCPRIWDIEEIERRMKYEEERRMKEARNERRSNSTVKGYTENS